MKRNKRAKVYLFIRTEDGCSITLRAFTYREAEKGLKQMIKMEVLGGGDWRYDSFEYEN